MDKVLNSRIVGNGSPNDCYDGSGTRRFGVFELNLRAGELRRNGLKVKLQEQPFQILAQLLEKPGEVVTREDLRNRLWPADTFVDFDHSLNAAIKRLRVALGDSAENPTFVETVARRGYRFLAPVSAIFAKENGSSPVASSTTESSSSQSRGTQILAPLARHSRVWWILAAGMSVVLVLVGIKLGLSLAQHHSAAQTQARISRLTANPAEDRVRAAAISRDGKYLAFSDETGFYLRQIDTGETHSIALPAGLSAESLSWFPDSVHMIAALRASTSISTLWEISLFGGNARQLSDDGRTPVISPDGKTVAFIKGNKLSNQIWLMAADGEQPRKLLGEPGNFFGSVAWSPDGARLAYAKGRLAYAYGVKGAIEFLDVRNHHVTSLLQLKSMGWFASIDGPLAWTRDGLIYTLAEAPPRQLDSNLWSVPIDSAGNPTSTPLRLTTDPGAVTSISTSADGKRVVYVKGLPEPDVYVASVQGPAAISEPVRLTLDDRQDLPFDWTPDNKAVLFISDRTGIFSVYRQGIDQAVPELLVGGNRPALGPRLSPDGTQLLYLVYPNWSDNTSSVSLMRMPLAGGAPQRLLDASWISNQQCARAPATLCLYSVVTADKFTLVSFDPLKGNGTQVYQLTGELPQYYNWSLSPDGSTVAITRWQEGGEDSRIRLVSLNGAPEKLLPIQDKVEVAALDWAVDSKSFWAASVGEEGNALLNIDLQGHTRLVWRPKKRSLHWAIPSRDGRHLALHISSSSANAWMLERP
jgi:Tol biopolymer transport system component/DNA-binding winged helix-turn-helix (wHTH) protein